MSNVKNGPLGRATLVKDNLPDFVGHAALYQVNPPISFEQKETRFVVVSTSRAFGLETYMFPASLIGEVLNWLELPGSQKGTDSHSAVLKAAGYSITDSRQA